MLHAFLHRKLDPLCPEPDRLEDALTSIVFGTLAHAGAGDALTAWLGRATVVLGSGGPIAERLDGVWFWPRLAHAEPDVLIRAGDRLLVIEAKLRSGKHGATHGDDDGTIGPDQIRRQWASLEGTPAAAVDPALAAALRDCSPALVYAVDRSRLGRACRELEESARGLPHEADLRLVTWQDLHAVLALRGRAGAVPLWARDLRVALERFGLASFIGFDVRALGVAAGADQRSELAVTSGGGSRTAIVVSWRFGRSRRLRWDHPHLRSAPDALRHLAPYLLRWAGDARRRIDGEPP